MNSCSRVAAAEQLAHDVGQRDREVADAEVPDDDDEHDGGEDDGDADGVDVDPYPTAAVDTTPHRRADGPRRPARVGRRR